MDSVPTYSAAHARLRRRRGAASLQPCSDCGDRASAWAYMHDCEDELNEAGRAYCLHTEHYSAKCEPCHTKFDGTDRSGEVNGRSLLTETQVMEMRQKYDSGGFSMAELGAFYGVHKNTVHRVVTGATWAHLPVLTDFIAIGKPKLTYKQAEEIRAVFAAGGTSQAELSRRYRVNVNVVRKIVNNLTYKIVTEDD